MKRSLEASDAGPSLVTGHHEKVSRGAQAKSVIKISRDSLDTWHYPPKTAKWLKGLHSGRKKMQVNSRSIAFEVDLFFLCDLNARDATFRYRSQ